MEVKFREFDPFNLWFWLKFETIPSNQEKQFVEELLNSWFLLGKLGGFNAENLQVQDAGWDLSYLEYDTSVADSTMFSLMHNMGEVEYNETWARCWFDLGTSDALGLDVLINALQQFSQEYVTIEKFLVGGENSDWPIPKEYQQQSDLATYN